jgi:Tfp pilus assembly protein PilF
VPVEDLLIRERVAAQFRLTNYAKARETLAPLIERALPAVEDLLRLVNIELAANEFDRAQTTLDRAAALVPENPVVLWSTYRIASLDGEYEIAAEQLRRLRKLAPSDYATRLALANVLAELGEEEEAEALYRELLNSNEAPADGWKLTTTYCLFSFLQQRGRVEDALPYQKELQRFEEAGVSRLRSEEVERGAFGLVQPPPRGELSMATLREAGGEVPVAKFAAAVDVPLTGCTGLMSVVRDDRWAWSEALWQGAWITREAALQKDPTEKSLLVTRVDRMPVEIMGYGPGGVQVARFEDGAWSASLVFSEPVTCAAALDLDVAGTAKGPGAGPGESKIQRDGLLDLVVAGPSGLVVLAADEGGWKAFGEPVIQKGFAISDICPLDFDHDGDLDVLVVGAGGVRLLRNDGFGSPKGALVDVTEAAGLPRATAFRWCFAEDPDGDNDVDVVLGGGHVFVGSNARGGRFTDRTDDLGDELRDVLRVGAEPLVADLNADGWTDLVAGGRWFEGGPAFQWTAPARDPFATLGEDPVLCESTPLGDAAAQVVSRKKDGTIRSSDAAGQTRVLVSAGEAGAGLLVCADVDGNGMDDLLEGDATALRIHGNEGSGNTITLSLRGVKDNRRAVGALIELRAGARYRRVFWHGEPKVLGLGVHKKVDILRVTWPNGIIQEVTDLAAGSYTVRQREGLGGSCPFLYTWDGETYTFISDVLGITPLGLPMGPGMLVPPDHDEYVLIRGDQMQARDGFFELQFTEELREVTYLDRIRLEVLDHPAGTEVYPNELFSFPPFPEAHTHTVKEPLAPTQAVDGEGRDWGAALATIDGEYAIPFEPLFGQFLGLAESHHLELSFDAEAVAQAERLRLVMTGWFYWTDASVNMAAARHPDVEFMPPMLSVPDGEGGWQMTGPPIGFPAGKLKTMVIDVTEILNRDDPRLRLTTTLQLYWDSIRLAIDDDQAEVRVTKLEPASARLWSRGFSEPLAVMGIAGMDWFEWDRLATQPRWNQHPGLYTAYGETLPLVETVDDQFVIMGAGDALHVRFDASLVPELRPGYVRDYQLFLDGWAKDRDPNTVEALHVEPLPFHGMTAYPYATSESFPDDAEHREWRVQWNTRLSKRWLEPLVPAAQGRVQSAAQSAAQSAGATSGRAAAPR